LSSPSKKSLSKTDIGFFCSPIGLGHATRDIAITQFLDRISLKFVTGNSAARLISDYGFSVNDSYVPPKFDVQNGALQGSLKWLWNYYQYYKKCKEIAQKFLNEEKPRLVVTDEDFASAVVAQQKNIPVVLITDVLQTNFTKGFGSIIEKKMNKSMKEIIQKCNTVIIPEFGKDQENIRRVGPIVRSTLHTREELRSRLSFDKKTVTVSVGGTDAGKFLIQKTIEACSKLKEDFELVVVSGPSLKIETKNVRNLGFVNNLHEITYASDLVVSLAGKSTIDESKAYGTPGIFIPIKGHFEQEDNARQEGYSFQDIFRLDSLISEKLESKRAPMHTEGAKKASQIITGYLR
jgi:UDP-N-acetylglucosamine--N-acetylmuramyl-(pentapeptide) pyrophosphoryl-undecaprenol N-acetylglucosamine transferase